MLEHLGHEACAQRIRTALEGVVREGKTVTRDLGGTAGTQEFADAIIARLG
jgi:isocitrate dehydrogenase (NAD+)